MATNRQNLKATIREIARATRDLERAAATSEDKVAAAFRRAEAKAFNRIGTLLSDGPDFRSVNLNRRLAWYFENIPSIEIAGENAGYFRAVRSYLDNYPRIGALAEDILAAGRIPADFATIPPELIRALRARDDLFFRELNAEALRRLDDTLLNSVVVGQTPSRTLQLMKGVITGDYPWGKRRGLYEWHAGTYVRTAQMRFARTIMKAKADELQIEHFMYVGPVDDAIRDFCAEIVGQVFTRAEIDAMDNGQTGNVFVDGGGYNCRHDWSPVSKEVFDDVRAQLEDDGDAVVDELKDVGFPAKAEAGK